MEKIDCRPQNLVQTARKHSLNQRAAKSLRRFMALASSGSEFVCGCFSFPCVPAIASIGSRAGSIVQLTMRPIIFANLAFQLNLVCAGIHLFQSVHLIEQKQISDDPAECF